MRVEAGGSGAPLPRKLGLKPGQRRLVVAAPEGVAAVLCSGDPEAPWFASAAAAAPSDANGLDYVHLFATQAAAIETALPLLRTRLRPAGMIWVSWPKRAAKVPTDVTEDVIRRFALAHALVDVKVCAVDPVWSGLKLVSPVVRRG